MPQTPDLNQVLSSLTPDVLLSHYSHIICRRCLSRWHGADGGLSAADDAWFSPSRPKCDIFTSPGWTRHSFIFKRTRNIPPPPPPRVLHSDYFRIHLQNLAGRRDVVWRPMVGEAMLSTALSGRDMPARCEGTLSESPQVSHHACVPRNCINIYSDQVHVFSKRAQWHFLLH